MADAPGTHPGLLRPRYPVRTERLLLRPLTPGDADGLLAYRSRADVSRYVPFEPMSRNDILERIAGQWSRTELTDEGQALTLGAEVAATGELAGDVILMWHSREHAGGEVGYVLNPRSEEHTSELQSHVNLVCRLLLEKKKKKKARSQTKKR